MKKIHELHNHPMTEYRENIPKDKVLVDREFGRLFSQTWEYWDDSHVIVQRSEFDKLKKYIYMSKSKEYKAIKNYIHNELGLTKEDIVKEVRPLIKELLYQYMHNAYGCDNDLEGWIRHMVANEIKNVSYDFVREMYINALKKTIADSLEIIVRPKENV